jgi:hypothetical protein
MEQVYHDVNFSMALLKCAGFLLLLVSAGYIYRSRPDFLPRWKNIAKLGGLIGILNAGLVVSFGKSAFPLTPVMLIALVLLFVLNKFPLYKTKHFLGLLVCFILTSLTFFVGIAGAFFHLAVEGKI